MRPRLVSCAADATSASLVTQRRVQLLGGTTRKRRQNFSSFGGTTSDWERNMSHRPSRAATRPTSIPITITRLPALLVKVAQPEMQAVPLPGCCRLQATTDDSSETPRTSGAARLLCPARWDESGQKWMWCQSTIRHRWRTAAPAPTPGARRQAPCLHMDGPAAPQSGRGAHTGAPAPKILDRVWEAERAGK